VLKLLIPGGVRDELREKAPGVQYETVEGWNTIYAQKVTVMAAWQMEFGCAKVHGQEAATKKTVQPNSVTVHIHDHTEEGAYLVQVRVSGMAT
jgi:hypothetical protein